MASLYPSARAKKQITVTTKGAQNEGWLIFGDWQGLFLDTAACTKLQPESMKRWSASSRGRAITGVEQAVLRKQ